MAFLAVLKKEGPKTQILFRFRIFINLHSSTGEGAIDHYTITSRLLVGKHERRTNCMNLPAAPDLLHTHHICLHLHPYARSFRTSRAVTFGFVT